MLRHASFVGLMMAVALAATANTASAGTIVAAAGSGPGLGTVFVPAIVTVQANNDEVPAQNPSVLDNNLLVPIKRFDFNEYIDIEFSVNPSDGVTEYSVFESVDNNTGLPWISYTMVLGFGTGANFVPSGAGDGLDFDAPEFNTFPFASAFPNVVTGEDMLVWSGGIQGAGAQTYTFRIDVPDLLLSGFTLRQYPTAVPEPSTLVMAGMGAIAAAAVAVRRRRRS